MLRIYCAWLNSLDGPYWQRAEAYRLGLRDCLKQRACCQTHLRRRQTISKSFLRYFVWHWEDPENRQVLKFASRKCRRFGSGARKFSRSSTSFPIKNYDRRRAGNSTSPFCKNAETQFFQISYSTVAFVFSSYFSILSLVLEIFHYSITKSYGERVESCWEFFAVTLYQLSRRIFSVAAEGPTEL